MRSARLGITVKSGRPALSKVAGAERRPASKACAACAEGEGAARRGVSTLRGVRARRAPLSELGASLEEEEADTPAQCRSNCAIAARFLLSRTPSPLGLASPHGLQ